MALVEHHESHIGKGFGLYRLEYEATLGRRYDDFWQH
jgi:hypothetical protein